MDIIGKKSWNGYISDHQTLYVNPYLVVNNKEYTKHYYIENQRIVSKLGGGFLMDSVRLFKDMEYGFQIANDVDYVTKKQDDETMVSHDLWNCGQPGALQFTSVLYDFLSAQPTRNDAENLIYYYHGDHLGSSAYITDASGMPSQHLDYLPFGETLSEEKTSSWQTPYKFNCKELDDESGLYYYGARYYDPNGSIWLGVDVLADSFPSWSPYRFCFDNPINITDITGKNEDGFIEVWNEKTDKYDQEKVNDKGGKETNFKEFRGGPLDGKLQTVNMQSGKSTWSDISSFEISPVTGTTRNVPLKDANWIIDLAAGGFAGGMLKSGAKKLAGQAGSKVDEAVDIAESWLGKEAKGITNKAGDNIFISKDGLRKIRFDMKNSHGDAPHIHLEEFVKGKWNDAIPGTHRIYPQK